MYGNYAETVLLYHRDGERKMITLSALWYALGLPEITWKEKTIQIFVLVLIWVLIVHKKR
ncbi:MAG TPA: hypothetical protein DCW33_04610 [Proteobacteria bacterium]|nr:hypothetical protein [Pseudomonadota bacterium]